ncbi:transporter substrate-binding domain-containing protein [Rhodovarius crocodyli]|nr:transporter substrate-binding domain-containing protein [Rhodovarius crocodyli]
MMKNLIQTLGAAAIALLPAATMAQTAAQGADTLAAVRGRGHLLCGVAGDLPGFSAAGPDQSMRGLDADYCRAVAAAVFGNAQAVRFVPQSSVETGIAALGSGAVDILARNATATFGRDTAGNVQPVGVLYYDGQGLLARGNAGVNSLTDLAGKKICVGTGGGLQAPAILERLARERNITFTQVPAASSAAAFDAFLAGQCDVVTGDRSALAARRAVSLPAPDAAVLLPETISREPLSPMVREGDARWRQIADWVLQALLVAEELGVNSTNLAQSVQVDDPEIRLLLGVDSATAAQLGLPAEWAVHALSAVGNYGEMFERNLGTASGIGLDRGLNDLWRRGGLHFPLPLR